MPDLFSRQAFAYAVFDTETSSLFPGGEPDHVQNVCRLASFGAVKASPTWASQEEWQTYVKPDGWVMHPEATKVNGLTTDFLHEHGRPVREVLDYFIACIEEGRAMCSFGNRFDMRVMHSEMVRAGLPTYIEKTHTICAMLASTGVVRAQREDGRIKTPKLYEAMRHFKLPQMGAHTALGDAISALQILRMLDRIKVNIEPRPCAMPREKKVAKAKDQAAPSGRAPNWLHPDKAD